MQNFSAECRVVFDTQYALGTHACSAKPEPVLKCGYAVYTVGSVHDGNCKECTFEGTKIKVNEQRNLT